MRLSFVILTQGREELLDRCLRSLQPSLLPDCDVLLVLNGAPSALAARLLARYPWAKQLKLEHCSLGEGRNRSVGAAAGEIIYFLDDDTVVPADFAQKALSVFLTNPESVCIGGPNLSPKTSSPLQRAADFLLRSPLGAGPMRVRYSVHGPTRKAPGWSFMLCNLGIRREVFERHGLAFPEHCAAAEENLLLWRIENKIGPLLYCPELFVYHERRARLAPLCRQIFRCGQGRMQITRIEWRSLHPATLAPLAFAIALVSSASLPPAALMILTPYAAGLAFESARLLILERDIRAAAWLWALFPLAHFSYALGGLRGLAPKGNA